MTNKPMLSVERELIQWLVDSEDLLDFGGRESELRALLDQPACTTPSGKTCPGDGVGACAKCPTAQYQGEPVVCNHEWTDDGEHLLVCTACGSQEDHSPGWRDMSTAPRDGTMLRLLVEFEEHPTEDEDQAPTIGANNFDNDDVDEWKFSGWCWTHDHFVEGKGIPVGWLPMLDGPKVTQGAEQPAPVAVVPDGYCIMPRRLTAENGAKALLLGEFTLEVTMDCPECSEMEEPSEGCGICDGEGEYGQKHTISWDQIKFIYSEAVKGLAK